MQGGRAAAEKQLADQIDSLKEQLSALKKRNAGELAKLQRDVDQQERRYRQALASWREALPE
jgi:uncharacterized protein involved in exopolysaccharide biosynthesis